MAKHDKRPMSDEVKARYDRFNQLTTRHHRLIRNLCWHHANGSTEVCNDLVQECYIRMWDRLDNLKASASEWHQLGWVVWQCRAACSHKAQKMRVRNGDMYRQEAQLAQESDELREKLEELMSVLKAGERDVVRLQLEGYTSAEIASMQGRTETTVSKIRQRAVQKMREYQQKIDAR